MPAPKALSSLPEGSNCKIGGLASPRPTQVALPGGTVLKQRWKIQMLPSLWTCTRMTSPQRPPFMLGGKVGQSSARRYGLGRSVGLGYCGCWAHAAVAKPAMIIPARKAIPDCTADTIANSLQATQPLYGHCRANFADIESGDGCTVAC